MKAWLGALAKLLVEFLMLLLLLSTAGAFAASLPSPGAEAFLLAALAAALGAWPPALALAMTTGLVSFGLGSRKLVALLSAGLLGLLLAAGGSWARGLEWAPPAPPPPRPLVGEALDGKEGLVSVGGLEGAAVRDLVAVDWKEEGPSLIWTPRASYEAGSGRVSAPGGSWSLLPRREAAGPALSTGLPFIDGLPPPLAPLGEGFFALLARAAGFVLLCLGLGSFSFALRRPMSALLLALLAALAALIADALAPGLGLPRALADLLGELGLALEPRWLFPAAEGLLGLLAASAGLALARGGRA